MQIAGTPDRVGSHPLITRIEKPLFNIRKMTLEGIGQRIDKSNSENFGKVLPNYMND